MGLLPITKQLVAVLIGVLFAATLAHARTCTLGPSSTLDGNCDCGGGVGSTETAGSGDDLIIPNGKNREATAARRTNAHSPCARAQAPVPCQARLHRTRSIR
jgi:hypothetical protein